MRQLRLPFLAAFKSELAYPSPFTIMCLPTIYPLPTHPHHPQHVLPGTYDPEHGEDHHSKDQHAEVQRQENHAEVPDSHLQPVATYVVGSMESRWGWPLNVCWMISDDYVCVFAR